LTKIPVHHPCCAARIKNHKSAGLTLTEVVIASAILVVAMVPILKGLTSAYLNTTLIERKTFSLMYCQAKLDEIKAKTVYNYSQSFSESNLSLGGSYLCNVADESAGGNLRKITVSVGFDLDGNNVLESEEIEVTLATYIAKRWDS
jgi:Tfp pilus assembly protein PilV